MPDADLSNVKGSSEVQFQLSQPALREVIMPEHRLSDELLACRKRTMALIYGTAMLERMDEQILPAVRSRCRSSTISSQSNHTCTSLLIRVLGRCHIIDLTPIVL